MSELEKATLQAISSDASATPMGDPIKVQFNPSSMKLEIKNETEGGESRGRQVRQYTGTSSTTLSLDLIFDTADEGETDAPVSVRTKTAAVEQFIYPTEQNGQKQAPPKLRFHWGDLILEGVVDGLSIDLDHFAANGVPLRAKVSFSFKEQDSKFEFLSAGPGANRGGSPPAAGATGPAALGTTAPPAPNRVNQAIGGESAAEFAARMGLPPEAWRGLDFSASAGGPLSLEAGIPVGFNATLSASAGLGATVGVSAGAASSAASSFGLQAGSGASGAVDPAQGFALSAAGGVGAAIGAVKLDAAQTSAAQAKQAFGAAPAKATAQAPPRPAMPEQPHTPLIQTGLPTPSQQQAAPPAPSPPSADPRAVTFGSGVPLRPTIGSAVQQRASILRGTVSPSMAALPVTSDPTVPGWVALQPAGSSTQAGSAAGIRHKAPCGCGCGGGVRR